MRLQKVLIPGALWYSYVLHYETQVQVVVYRTVQTTS